MALMRFYRKIRFRYFHFG